MSSTHITPPAVILSFPRKRGRPKAAARPSHDHGTPELAMKRLMGDTMEALDLCLERGLIDDRQHWCGIHLRWLYTLRHGAPSVSALNPAHLGGMEIKNDDPSWRTARELEYNEALNLLARSGHALIVMNLCVFNERPAFLKAKKNCTATTEKRLKLARNEAMLQQLRDGLDLLVQHWRRNRQKR